MQCAIAEHFGCGASNAVVENEEIKKNAATPSGCVEGRVVGCNDVACARRGCANP